MAQRLPQIKSNPITGSSISAWGKSTSFQTTQQAAQLDLFYKKPGQGSPAAAQPSAAAGAGAGAMSAGKPPGSAGAASPSKGGRDEMASMYATSIASMTSVNAGGKRGAESGLCFLSEWFDTAASVVRKYHFFFFPLDSSVEMFDIKNKRTFLKRCPFPSITLKDLFVGATVSVYGRQLKLIGYGDEYTRAQLEDIKARTLALIRPEAYGYAGKIIDSITRHGLTVAHLKLTRLSAKEALEFCAGHASAAQALTDKPVIALEVIGKDAQAVLSANSGADAKDAKQGGGGGEGMQHVLSSGSSGAAAAELSFFFEQPRFCPALLSSAGVSVLVVRPHAVAAGALGQIIDQVLNAGFEITAAQSFHLDKTAAEEFLEVYKGVLPEYSNMVEQMSSGACVALEVVQHDSKVDTVQALRALCGPIDPVIGKHIRPNSLRARFGVDRVRNAVHCTDLPEDGQLEAEFFFSILQKK